MSDQANRRDFLRTASVAGTSLLLSPSLKAAGLFTGAPNDKVVLAVMGTNSRGAFLSKTFAGLPNVEVGYICDVDSNVLAKTIAEIEKITGKKPKGFSDIRQLLNQKDFDGLAIAAPDHWHAPSPIRQQNPSGHETGHTLSLQNLSLMKNTLFLFIALFITAQTYAQKKLFPKAPGMVSYTYRNSFSRNLPATLDTIKALGITDMEFSNLFGKTAADIRKLLDERGVHCSSFGVGYPDLQTKLAEVGQNAKTLGAQFVRVAWIPHKGPFTLELAKQTVADFNQFGKELKEKFGLTFCYHNHGYEFETYEKGTLFDYIVQNTYPQHVSFELDILWTVFPGQDPAALLKKYPKRFKLMHLKDLRKGVVGNLSGGTPVENDVALGTGQIDLPAVLKTAQKSDIQHYYIEDESPSYGTQIPQTIAYLKGLTQ